MNQNKQNNTELKSAVSNFWNIQSCGEVYATGNSEQLFYQSFIKKRYQLEPYIFEFARFEDGRDKDVLEIGVGMGADHLQWAKSRPKFLAGIDLTSRAISHATKMLGLDGYKSKLMVADAENLPFEDGSFDLVYSWGVIHHSPNTEIAVKEIFRVLRKGGEARIMIYHKYSLTGFMLWIRYALLKGHPFLSLESVYAEHLESPGTKAYTMKHAREMFSLFSRVEIKRQLSFGDLLLGEAGQRHKGILLKFAKLIWPRWLLKKIGNRFGLMLTINVKK